MSTVAHAIAFAVPTSQATSIPVGLITAVCIVVTVPKEDVIACPLTSTLEIASTEPRLDVIVNAVGLIVISVNALNVLPKPEVIVSAVGLTSTPPIVVAGLIADVIC